MTAATELPELSTKDRWRRNWFATLFVVLTVLAVVVVVCGVLSKFYPDSGIPLIWVAFPVGPQPAPIP